MKTFDQIVTEAGLRLVEEKGWRDRERAGSFAPVGVMVHHTAGSANGNAPSWPTVVNGREGIPGPLGNFLIARDGTVILISDGRCNDSGRGSSVVLNEVIKGTAPRDDAAKRNLADDTDGNPYFIDIEVEHVGTHGDYPQEQVNALVKLCAALCGEFGWTANQNIHHREWTRRKIDMSWKGDLRGAISAEMSGVRVGRTVIKGSPTATREQAIAWAHSRGATQHMIDLINAGWQHAVNLKIDPAVFVAQAAKETKFGAFGRAVTPQHYNSCGLKIRDLKVPAGHYPDEPGRTHRRDDDPNAHMSFASWSEGTLAHIAHLGLYAGWLTAEQAGRYGDPRNFSSLHAKAPTVEQLGGSWAPAQGYGVSIVQDYLEPMRAFKIADKPAPDSAPRLPIVQAGDSGYRVRQVQALLLAAHHAIAVDGDFGASTTRHVQAYQQHRGLTPDGIVGDQTWIKLVFG